MLSLALFMTFFALIHSKGVYDFYVKDLLTDSDVSLSTYKGKVSLITNVASECGFTDSHYKAYRKTQDLLGKGGRFIILAFPCNQFGAQEPGTPRRIHKFIYEQYHANYAIYGKTDVIGEKASDLWKYLRAEANEQPQWNFYKYLVDHNGKLLRVWPHTTPVEDIFFKVQEAVDRAEQELGRLDKPFDIHDILSTEEMEGESSEKENIAWKDRSDL